MPRVSVVIPAYNCASYLAGTVASALAQNFKDLEVLVVDDGSTDTTEAVVRRLGANVRYIKTENEGPAAARNRGILASSGDYIALLDADDSWEPRKLREQMPEFEKDEAVGLVYSDLHVHEDDGTVIPSFLSTRPLASSGYVFDQYLRSKFIITSTVILRRSCLEQVGLFDESMRSLEDCDFFLRFCHRWKVALVNQSLVRRRQRAGNLSSNEDLHTRYVIQFQHKALEIPDLSPDQFRELRRQLANAHFKRGHYCLRQRLLDESRKNLRLSVKYDGKNSAALAFLAASYLPPELLSQLKEWRRWWLGRSPFAPSAALPSPLNPAAKPDSPH
jgi:glycosyltransferase involved in cell wall biosynthesis